MNFKLLGTGVAALALLATSFSAQAADIPRPIYKSARSVVAYYNWTGFYLGANGGYGWGTSDWTAGPVGVAGLKPKGWLAGGTLGYNYQIGSFVWGLEGDFDWSDIKASSACGIAGVVSCETEQTWLSTFRGRLGYAFDRWLPYITGGGAYGHIKATAAIPGLSATASSNQLGWTVGAGLEYAFLSNWSAKIEYLYVDLGSFNTTAFSVVPINIDLKENIVRAGLNYKFSGPIFSRF
jgi:outer membrane immunogenic protein